MQDDYSSFICLDCGINTLTQTEEYYVVHDDVWLASGLTKSAGMLCIGCLEERIGRELTAADFPDYPINKGVFPHSTRLQLRMAA